MRGGIGMKIHVSAVVLAKNEEPNIRKCLESVNWCDEIIIIDDYSSDKTVEIAQKYKARVYLRSLDHDFSAQRNFGLSKAKNEWVLSLDADEIVSDALAYEIMNAIRLKGQNLEEFKGFYIKRMYFMWGKKLRFGETGCEQRLRLARKTAGQWEGKVHERWKIKGLVGELANPILHFPHQTMEEFIRKINFYTDLRSQELKFKKKKVYFWFIFLYPAGKFAVNYILRKGFMDGIPGLIFALSMSFHSFLVRGKLWLMLNKK